MRTLKYERVHQPSESEAGFHYANFHMTLTSGRCTVATSYIDHFLVPMEADEQVLTSTQTSQDTETSVAAQLCQKSRISILVILVNTPGWGWEAICQRETKVNGIFEKWVGGSPLNKLCHDIPKFGWLDIS